MIVGETPLLAQRFVSLAGTEGGWLLKISPVSRCVIARGGGGSHTSGGGGGRMSGEPGGGGASADRVEASGVARTFASSICASSNEPPMASL